MPTTVEIDAAQARLREIVAGLQPGEEVVLTENDRPVATLTAAKPRPQPGLCKGMLVVLEDDDAHLQDFKEYMP